MGLSLYLAMTAAEIESADHLPQSLAYMACHFSPYTTGLSNLPDTLPKDTLLILNDRTPICGHDPYLIIRQLRQVCEEFECRGLLVDFQRPDYPECALLAAAIAAELPYAIMSDLYAEGLTCPVFLPPPPLLQPLQEYLSPWEGREIWLEAAPDAALLTVTEDGSLTKQIPYANVPANTFIDSKLHCRYRTEVLEDSVQVSVYRTEQQLEAMLAHAAGLGVCGAVGLYQQLQQKDGTPH